MPDLRIDPDENVFASTNLDFANCNVLPGLRRGQPSVHYLPLAIPMLIPVRIIAADGEGQGLLHRRYAASPVASFDNGDDALRMIILCCRPEIPRDTSVALSLKMAVGSSVREVARVAGGGHAARAATGTCQAAHLGSRAHAEMPERRFLKRELEECGGLNMR